MSWITAAVSRDGSRTLAPHFSEASLHSVSLPGFSLVLGGNPDTCFFESSRETATGWAVAGTGIRVFDSRASLLTQADWALLLSQSSFDPASIDGHFVAVRWRNGVVECFTDQLGLRTLYFTEQAEGIYLSTQLDTLARATRHGEIDFASLGSRWLMYNQVSYSSCVTGIERVGPGGYVAFDRGSVRTQRTTHWLPSFKPEDAGRAVEIVGTLIDCAFHSHHVPSLGLSGGIDSRMLLALLTCTRRSGFFTHTFGDLSDPDVRIAREMTAEQGIANQYFHEPLPDVGDCITAIRSFVTQTGLIEPATSFLKLRHYPKLREEGKLLIDGGFGEIARRQYLNRVVKLGRSALRNRDAGRLLRLMWSPRADIFSSEVTNALQHGARRSLTEALEHMPPVEKIGVENFADLFSVRTRLPNYGGPEQARLDSVVLNFMPLVQPSFLRAVFGMPVRLRSNANFYYDAIRKSNPALQRFPLVRSGFTYPFGLSSTGAWALIRMKSRMFKGHSDPGPHHLLNHIREYVLDLARSQEVVTNPMYDAGKITDSVTRYYRGEIRLRSTVDWWLTFEFWRQGLSAGPENRD